ncbi:hypothetical protein BAC2_02026 [uncultured bacterium]|nr:hypothetical protein BAC2_02026 [uncultured bacterium]
MSDDAGVPAEHKDMDALFRAIGFVVVQWGQAEQSLDLLVAALFQECGGKRLARKNRIPVMLAPKLEFVSKCVSQLPKLAPFNEEGLALVGSFERLSQKRHDLIHGAVASLSPVDEAFSFVKLDVKDNFHHAREVRLEASEFPVLTKELVRLGADATTLARKVWDQCVKLN